MATNEIHRYADALPLAVPAGTKSGDPVQIGGSINGIAVTDRASGGNPLNADGSPNATYLWGGGNTAGQASVWTEGSFKVKVNTAASMTVGTKVYYDPAGTPSKLTTTAGTLKPWGVVLSTITNNGDGTWTGIVKIIETVI